MKKFLLGALSVLGLGTLMTSGAILTGVIDFAADNPHNPTVHRLIEWTREISIARSAANIEPPANLSDAERIRRGAGNYEAMCANCHLSPGVEDSEIRKGLYPIPPNLSKSEDEDEETKSDQEDALRFWVIKHGIKASGMPAWSKGGMSDEAIWDLTAFLKVMPSLSLEAYRQQIAASNGHSHEGLTGHDAKRSHDHSEMPQDETNTTSDEHSHDIKPHTHKHGDHKH